MRTTHTYECLDINPERRMREVGMEVLSEYAQRMKPAPTASIESCGASREFELEVRTRLRDRAILAYASACMLVSRSERRGPHSVRKGELIKEIGTANIDAIEAALAVGWLFEGRDAYFFNRPSNMNFRTRIQ